jgi:chromosome segregation ATPase
MFAAVAVAIALWCMWLIFLILRRRPSRAELKHRVAELEQDNSTHLATIAGLKSEVTYSDASRRELSDRLRTIVMEAMDLKDNVGVLQRQLFAEQGEVIDLRQQLSVARREVADLQEALSRAFFLPAGPAPPG